MIVVVKAGEVRSFLQKSTRNRKTSCSGIPGGVPDQVQREEIQTTQLAAAVAAVVTGVEVELAVGVAAVSLIQGLCTDEVGVHSASL